MKIDKTLINSYPRTLRRLLEEKGGDFVIEYPDPPGCISDGDNPGGSFQKMDMMRCLRCARHGDPYRRRARLGGSVCREAWTPASSPERAGKASA
jgi:hypothetical protein